MDCDPAWLLCPSDCPGKDAGASCHSVSPADLPGPGIEPGSPTLQADSLYRVSHQGSQHSTQDTFKSPFLSPPRVLHQEICDSHVIVCSSLHMRGKDVPVENEANGKYCPGGVILPQLQWTRRPSRGTWVAHACRVSPAIKSLLFCSFEKAQLF